VRLYGEGRAVADIRDTECVKGLRQLRTKN